ncbi:MAG: zf-HC2 domain-containing protein [Anaerolineales bacterium]|nr:zf-HC2 domain-containing protein [Anaerolineales bacterium]
MVKHITPRLSAYLDGELPDAQLRQMEKHLAECDECQAELEQMRNLSALLHETNPADEFLPTARFVANLTLNLPRQPMHSQPRRALEIGWSLIPIGALGVWLFFQITFSLSSVILTVSETGLLGNGLSWLQGNPPQTRWFSMAMNLFGGQIGFTGKFILSALNDLSLFIQDITSRFIWQALFATLYLGWLASWWQRQSNQAIPEIIVQM